MICSIGFFLLFKCFCLCRIQPISDGARGVDMGRNIFQSEHPAAMCRAVAKIVHEKFTDREAFQFYQELAAQDN